MNKKHHSFQKSTILFKKKNFFYRVNLRTFWRSGGKHPFGWWKIKKDGNLGDSARGQADPGSAAVYTLDRPGSWVLVLEILLDPIHKKFLDNFSRVAASEWVSFTCRNDAVRPSKQKYGLFAPRGSREGKLYSWNFLPRIPGAEPGAGSRRFKFSICVDLNRQPLIAAHSPIK